MKVGSKVIFLSNDANGFGSAISDALQPNPDSSLQRSYVSSSFFFTFSFKTLAQMPPVIELSKPVLQILLLSGSVSCFDLSLEGYGIKDQKASGKIVNFIDPQGSIKVCWIFHCKMESLRVLFFVFC